MTTGPDISATRRREHLFRLSQPTADCAIKRVGADKYQISYRIRGQEWARFDLLSSASMSSPPPGGYSLLQLNQAGIDLPWLSIDHLDASVVHSGATWLGDTANAGAYGGSYRQNNTGTGEYVEWTAPAGTMRVGARMVAASNCGIHKVTINGDATKANLLPTAQQLVDLGRLASTALVAGGGTLNPTDRVLDQHAQATAPGTAIAYDRHYAIADGLDSGTTQVVRVTITGYQNTLSSGFRLYTSGFTYGKVDTTSATALMDMLPVKRILSQFDSAYEYAHEFTPPTFTNYIFVGNVHGYESPVSFQVYVDGQAVAMTDGQRLTGAVEIVRLSELRHPSTGTTKQADVKTVYRMGATGLTVEHVTTWATACTLRRSYPAMFPVNGDTFTKGSFTDGPLDYALTANAGAYLGMMETDTIYAWEPIGDAGALLHLPDLNQSVNNWSDSAAPYYAAIEDRVPQNVLAGNLSKLYMTRVGPNGPAQTVAVGQVQKSTAVYRLWRSVDVGSALAR